MYTPAVLVESKDVALVLDTCDTANVPMSRGKDIIVEVRRASSTVRVFGSIVPQKGHHHLAIVCCKELRNFGHKRQILGFRSWFQEDAITRPHYVTFRVPHCWITLSNGRPWWSGSVFIACVQVDQRLKWRSFPGPAIGPAKRRSWRRSSWVGTRCNPTTTDATFWNQRSLHFANGIHWKWEITRGRRRRRSCSHWSIAFCVFFCFGGGCCCLLQDGGFRRFAPFFICWLTIWLPTQRFN